jgi:HK97 family phage prohead protease
MTDTPTEARTYSTTLELRDVQAVGRPYQYLEGLAVPYDTWADVGWFLESHRAGSFKRSTNGRSGKGLPLLLFHDNRSWPIGHAERWDHDTTGMRGVWKLNDGTDAQTAARMAELGDLVGLSVGFQDVATPEWSFPDELDPFGDLGPDHKARCTRIESRLVEVSMTPTPAFADAGVTMVRTRARRPTPPPLEVDHWRAELETLRSAP